MTWTRLHPSFIAVLAVNLVWMLVALASPAAWGPYLWTGEASFVEILEVVLIVAYAGLWLLIARRLRARADDRLPRMLALAMVAQLVVMLSEELDFCNALRLPHRNFRMAARVFIPEIMDTPLLSAYLVFFVLVPIVPLARVQTWLVRTAPVRAERSDSWAAIVGTVGTVVVFLVAGDHELGELQQVVMYALLGVITVRIVRKTKAT